MSVEEQLPDGEAAYDRFADDYRTWWAPVIAPSAIRLLARLDGQFPAGEDLDLVDVGAGTGTLSLAALGRWPRVRVLAVDPARRMLEVAEASARDGGFADRLTVRVGDAADLPMPDESVDGVMSSFVIQLLPSRAAMVREAFRVLRPGGLFACLAWRADTDPFEPEDAFDDALEALRISPPEPVAGHGRSYASAASAAAELRRAGFRQVSAREEWLIHRFTPKSLLDVMEHWTEDETFLSLDEPMRRRLRADVLPRLERLPPDALIWRRPLVSVVGRRPGRVSGA